ncbi:phosphatase PAP2 family protein [Comamonadaceae bacterium OTU4NAUVB1]|nr:phosphatase PAP2 family protein [Comamonadaceae bacterium OTU4NAUVB1]
MNAARSPWAAEIALRMRRHFVLKFIGTTAFTCLFFVGYFHLLRHPGGSVTVMPLTVVDGWIAFRPEALPAYLSLWLYVGFGPGLQRDLAALLAYAAWIVAMCATGLLLFYLWPTAIPPPDVDASGFPGFALLQGVDAAGNACPSMHVAAAMFTVLRVAEILRVAAAPATLRVLNVAWFLAIAWSTLATRQHVALDALAGALLGLAFALPSMRWRPVDGAPARRRIRRVPSISSNPAQKTEAHTP